MDPRIRLLLRIIDERRGRILATFGETSRLLGISEAHLRRLFRTEVGVSLGHHVLAARMAQAAQRVKNSTFSMKEIAFASGYDDISNFYRDFKKVHGRSPRQLRVEQLQLRLRNEESPLGDLPSSTASMD